MLKRIEDFVLKKHMIEKDDRIVLGVSGGADSVCLFYVMLELKQKYNIDMVVVHVNHGIRGEAADNDEEFVRTLCEKHEIPFECVRVNIPKLAKEQRLTCEEAGRKVRYQAFEQTMEKYGCNKIAVAHNQNDQSETVLLNLFRGSGLRGIAGIDAIRGKIVRPLLQTGREEIENYLDSLGIQYQNDLSNFEEVYTRNKVRLKVLPYVEREINTKASMHIAQTSEIMREMCDFVECEIDKLYKQIVRVEEKIYYISKAKFLESHIMLRKELLRKVIFELSGKYKDVEACHIVSIIELVNKGVGKKVDLPYQLECLNDYDDLILRPRIREQKVKQDVCLKINKSGVYEIPEKNITIETRVVEIGKEQEFTLEKIKSIPKTDYTKCFDYDKIKNAVLVRYRKAGDYFQCNSAGSNKKLKEYFINEKIPFEQRESILLLADGNHIMWIVGHRISEYYKVDNKTNNILIVKINGGLKNGRQY